jgi:hypothetical protein
MIISMQCNYNFAPPPVRARYQVHFFAFDYKNETVYLIHLVLLITAISTRKKTRRTRSCKTRIYIYIYIIYTHILLQCIHCIVLGKRRLGTTNQTKHLGFKSPYLTHRSSNVCMCTERAPMRSDASRNSPGPRPALALLNRRFCLTYVFCSCAAWF